MATETVTPMLRQYQKIKAQHKDCILFFRLGDFYEMFYEDAKVASSILDLVLTSRGKGTANHVPMCGIPFHAADNYIARLIKAGHKVAICEQVEDPAQAKGIVKRDVIRIISSGTFLDENTPDSRYILCLNPDIKPGHSSTFGAAFIDPASGTIQANEYKSVERILHLISHLPIYECVYPLEKEEQIKPILRHPLLSAKKITTSPHDDWCFNPSIALKTLCEHFGVRNLKGFGVDEKPFAISASGALLEYLRNMNKQPLRHIDRLSLYADDNYVFISPAAIYGLELEGLFKCLNHTSCALGKRLLRYWIYHPLKQPAAILQRQAAVTLLKENTSAQQDLMTLLGCLPDVEKNISKLSCGYIHAKDILALRQALCLLPEIKEIAGPLQKKNRLFTLEDIPVLREELSAAVNPDMPLSKSEGKVIRPGYHDELDALRDIQENGRQWLKNFQQRESKRSGINSLKVGFNKVFGYYIEITKTRLKSAPDDYIRKQTLVNAERFITSELKTYEEKILTAQEKILKIENEILKELRKNILDHSVALHNFAHTAATLDALCSLSYLARLPQYTAPEVNEEDMIDITEGRHPVVEKTLNEPFVPNDTFLDCEENHLIILTGPNMAGKSTYIRQVAILTIMAQIGSYVPAAKARIGVVDKIFTRIGAHDDITKGQSTFMVEMSETADIANNMTDRSLIILDEIGRGTSTFDGLSLAWALAEHLQSVKARTLFATHFHELTALAEKHSGVKNFNVAVKEWKDEIIFLHKIIPGSTDDSYGIYVAKLAGVPKPIIDRSKKILTKLELQSNLKERLAGQSQSIPHEVQLPLFYTQDDSTMQKVKDILTAMDLNNITPLQAFGELEKMKRIIENEH